MGSSWVLLFRMLPACQSAALLATRSGTDTLIAGIKIINYPPRLKVTLALWFQCGNDERTTDRPTERPKATPYAKMKWHLEHRTDAAACQEDPASLSAASSDRSIKKK